MNNILFEIIITNACNKRCNYCDLDFKDTVIESKYLNRLIDIMKKNKDVYTINFFGGEPLLYFEKIKYFIEQSHNIPLIKYSVGTNGVFLDDEKLFFFNKHNVEINLSIDNLTSGKGIDFERMKRFEKLIHINFINDPVELHKSKELFDILVQAGFTKINFMPVFGSNEWNQLNLKYLFALVKYIDTKYNHLDINYFSYFNGVALDKQFVIETNGNLYQDLDSLLWLQKQYNSVNQLFNDEIENMSFLGHISTFSSIDEILNQYKINDVLDMVQMIPQRQQLTEQYSLINKIFNHVRKTNIL